MAPSLAPVARNVDPEQSIANQQKFQAYYAIGIVIAVALAVGITVWLVVRRYRKRAAYRREREERIRALNVRGLVKSNGDKKRCVFGSSDEVYDSLHEFS